MTLNSLLASLKSDGSGVSGVQAIKHGAFGCNATKKVGVSGVSLNALTREAETFETPCNATGVSMKSPWIKGCTPETSETPEKINPQRQTAPVVDVVKIAPNSPSTAAMTGEQEAAIRAWLALTAETDPATIAEVIGQCQRDADARAYFTGRAAAELPKPDPFSDDRRTCSQCRNLRGRVCSIATPGGLVSANLGYRPAADTLQRCAGYLPNATDTNQ